MKAFDLENKIKAILKVAPATQNDDMLLYLAYIEAELGHNDLLQVFSSSIYRKQHNICTFESVSRCRRKIQEAHPELSCKLVKEARINKQQDYENYALGNNTNI